INAVAGYNDIGRYAFAGLASAGLLEMHCSASIVLLDADAFAVGHHRVFAKALLYGLVQNDVQPATMNANFGKGVSGKFSALFAVNELPETIEETAVAIFDAGLEQFISQAERGEFTHGMWQQGDADAEWLDLRRALIDAAVDAALPEIKCKREPTNPAA